MRSQSSRAALVAAALALALAISGAVVIHAFAQAPASKETTPPSPPVKVKVKGEPVHSMPGMDHSAMDHGNGAAKGKYMTIVGEVMDPACFLEAGSKSIGPGHYQCAYDCARSGQTLAIYARDEDRIYFVAGELPGKNPNEPLLPYVHKKVDVSGTVYHRSDAWGIVITKVALHDDKAGGKASAPAGAPGGK